MAARNRPGLAENTRQRIRTGMLIKRLERHVLGEKDENDKVVKLSSTQVTAALGLLRKTLPDMAVVEHSGEVTTAAQFTEFLRSLNGTERDVVGSAQDGGEPLAEGSDDIRH